MIRWFAAHPTAANLLMVLLLAAGLVAAPALQRETFPDYRPVEVGIDVVYRGASATDVEDAVCRRLHETLQGVDALHEFVCVAQDNLASATATMRPGADAIRFRADVDAEVAALTDLPARADPPVVRQLHRSDLVAAVALRGDLPLRRLEDYALALRDRLYALPGVAEVEVRGLATRQWEVALRRDVLTRHGLSARALAETLRRQNVDLPLGMLETPERDILLRFTDQRRSLGDLASLVVVSGGAGGEVTLGEIATLAERGEQAEEQVWFDGERALVLEVSKGLGEDALEVMAGLEALLETERARHPGGLRLDITQDMTGIVRDRLQMLVGNGLMGLALVLAVMSLFFRPRLAVWAALGLPVAFTGAFAVMALAGLSLNMITLVALLMAIGIVMDDAIVITDNVDARATESHSPLQAVVAGTRQVLPGVLSSFFTTAAVFAPLSFLAGELGAVLEVLPVVLVAALAASLIEAFWILPHHLKGSLASVPAGAAARFRARFDLGFARLREAIGRVADAGVRYRYGVFALVLVVLLGSAGFMAAGHVGREAMPAIDGDVLEARILMPQGTPLGRTQEVARRVAEAMRLLDARFSRGQPGGEALVRAIQVRFNHNPSAREAGPHAATVIVDLLTAERRSVDLAILAAAWREQIGAVAGIDSLIIQEPGFGPAGIPLEIRLRGEDLARLDRAARELADHLAGYRGVTNVIDDLRPGKPQVRFGLAPGAHALGLSAEDVASQLRAAVLGDIADIQRVGDWDIDVLVRLAEPDRQSLGDLTDLRIRLPDGRQVPLEVAVEMQAVRDWAKITRIDGVRTVTVEADVDARRANAQAIVADLRGPWLADFLQRHPGVEVRFEGQVARTAETGGSIGRGLLLGLLGVFVVLSLQFRSYVEPLAVMVSIPLAFVGAVWGHVLMGYFLSMPSLIGAASLAGIVVNNAILLIQVIKQHRTAGLTAAAAAGRASRERLRAILISSATTIAGLLPLLAETSTQAAAIKPLVISVVFGLLSATLAVLLVLPALYVLFDDWGWTGSRAGDHGSQLRPGGELPAEQAGE